MSEAQPSWAGVGQPCLVHPGAGLTRGPGARCSPWSRVALTCRGPPPLAPEQLLQRAATTGPRAALRLRLSPGLTTLPAPFGI